MKIESTPPPPSGIVGSAQETGQIRTQDGQYQQDSVGFASGDEELKADFAAALSLFLDPPEMGEEDRLALLMSLQAKYGNESSQSATEAVKANADKLKTARAEEQKKLMEAAAEMAKAKESGLIGQIFGWIGVAVAIIAAVAVSVATFGAAAPASGLAIAGCIAAVTGAVLAGTTQIVQAVPGAMESMGKENAQAFMYSMMALQIACAIVSIGAGFGGAVNAAKSGTDTAKVAAEVASKAGKIEMAAEKIGKAGEIVEGATTIGEVGADVAAAEQTNNAEHAKADAAVIVKFLKSLAAMDERAIEFIRAVQKSEEKGWNTVIEVSKEQNDLNMTVARQFQGPSI
jgi:transloator